MELALALPVLCMVVWAAVWVVGAAGTQLSCVDAARAGARATARGEDPLTVLALVRSLAPPGAAVSTSTTAAQVTIRVTVRTRPWPAGWRGLVVQGVAVARPEAPAWMSTR